MTAGVRSVLVVSLGGLGDFITRWPLWQSVRRSFPRARVTFLGDARHARLLLAARLSDGAEEFDSPQWAAPEKLPFSFDVAVSALGARGGEWVARLVSSRPSRVITVEPFPPEGERRLVSAHIESEIRAAGLAEPGALACPLPDNLRSWAAALLAGRGLEAERTVAIHPGSGSPAKNWPRGRFEELARLLAARGRGVLVLEGDAERHAPAVRDRPGIARISGIEIEKAAALLSICGGYVGNDSGVSHLAALMGVPSTVIFGPTDPAVWAPRGERVAVAAARVPCAPCGGDKMKECRDRRCLVGVGVDNVLSVSAYGRDGVSA